MTLSQGISESLTTRVIIVYIEIMNVKLTSNLQSNQEKQSRAVAAQISGFKTYIEQWQPPNKASDRHQHHSVSNKSGSLVSCGNCFPDYLRATSQSNDAHQVGSATRPPRRAALPPTRRPSLPRQRHQRPQEERSPRHRRALHNGHENITSTTSTFTRAATGQRKQTIQFNTIDCCIYTLQS